MNSLSELNSYGSTTVSYTDSREPNLKFDRPTPDDNTVSLEQKDSHNVPVGINVIEVIQAASVAATYTIDLSAASGNATITAGSLPSGVTMTNPSTGVYVFSGWDSVSDWNSIRSPQIDLAIGYTGSFSYTATIAWYGSNSLSWTVDVTVASVVILEDPAPATYFTTSATNLLTAPEILTNKPGTYTVTITPSQTTYISTMAAAIADPTPICSFNNTTKVMTLTGTLANVKTYLANINVTYTSSATANFSYTYDLTSDNPDASADTVTQTATVQSYVAQPTGNGVYVAGTLTDVTNQPQITNGVADPYSDIANSYTLTVTPQDASIISSISTDSWYTYPLTTNYTVSPSTVPDGRNNFVLQTKLSPTGTKLIVFSGNNPQNGTDNGGNPWTYLYEYTKSGDSWSLNSTLTEDLGDLIDLSIVYSDDDSILIVGDSSYYSSGFSKGKITVYERSAGTLSSIATLVGGNQYADLGRIIAINQDATRIATTHSTNSDNKNTEVRIYTRSGSTLTLAQTITGTTTEIFGNNLSMSKDGNYLAISDCYNLSGSDYQGKVYIYEYSGGSYSLSQTLTGAGATDYFGDSLWMNPTGNTLWVSSSNYNSGKGRVYQYGRSASTWTLGNTIDHPSVGDSTYDRFGTATGGTGFGAAVFNGIQASSDGLYVAVFSSTVSGDTSVCIFKTLNGSYQFDSYFVSSDSSWTINDTFTEVICAKVGEATNKFYTASRTTNSGSLSADKVLTLTANKIILNRIIQNVSVNVVTGTDWNFNLTYAVTTPASASGSSTQLIEPQGD